jgi:hypothetical protein
MANQAHMDAMRTEMIAATVGKSASEWIAGRDIHRTYPYYIASKLGRPHLITPAMGENIATSQVGYKGRRIINLPHSVWWRTAEVAVSNNGVITLTPQ